MNAPTIALVAIGSSVGGEHNVDNLYISQIVFKCNTQASFGIRWPCTWSHALYNACQFRTGFLLWTFSGALLSVLSILSPAAPMWLALSLLDFAVRSTPICLFLGSKGYTSSSRNWWSKCLKSMCMSMILHMLIFWPSTFVGFALLSSIIISGGLTTFSSFSNDTYELLASASASKDGKQTMLVLWAVANVLLNVVLCIFATYIGYLVAR